MVAHTYSSRTWETEPEGLPQVQCHPGLHSEFQPIRELSFPKNLGEGNRAAPHQGGSGQHLSRKPNQRPGTSPSRLGDNARLEKQAAWKRPLSTRILQRLEFLAEQEARASPQGQVLLSSGQRAQPPLTQVAAHCLSKTRAPGERCPQSRWDSKGRPQREEPQATPSSVSSPG